MTAESQALTGAVVVFVLAAMVFGAGALLGLYMKSNREEDDGEG